MKKTYGILTISLDFELYWGIRDKKTIHQYGKNILGAWEVVPRLLALFEKHQIHATWAVVGAMICKDAEDFKSNIPAKLPSYSDEILSPYFEFADNLERIGSKYLFGGELLDLVKKVPNQEIGTHSFSHYYCLEDGQTKAEFEADLQSSIQVLQKNGIQPVSYVFPRHQINQDYLKQFANQGISIYRGTEKAWYHSAARGEDEGILKRAFRYADYFVKLGSHHCQDISEVRKGNLYEIRASRWLRPYSEKLEKLDFLKIRRIKNQMNYAAKKGKIFHLWFHPHDIGRDIDENFRYLEILLREYNILKDKYGMKSLNFQEIRREIDETVTI